jgi:Secretion system C-terminal sorting domain
VNNFFACPNKRFTHLLLIINSGHMKHITLLIFIQLLGLHFLYGQLFIAPGAEIKMTGDALLTLQNTDLVNNGIFNQTEGTILFTGNTNTSISGNNIIRFDNLQVAKSVGNKVSLQRIISVDNEINFTGGNIDLNGSHILLSSTALLIGENNNSRITTTTDGYIEVTNTLNNPSSLNPGNLGAIFTSAASMGSTRIRRGHRSQVNGNGIGSSVLRYYDILPTTNSALNATLRFHYFDGELNSFDENTVVLWKSIDNSNWTNEGFTSRNTASNFVEKTGISSFSRWTLSSVNNPLPVLFTLFNGRCEGNGVLINWRTAQEQNSSYFKVERSNDGNTWSAITTLPAAGNSSIEKNYSFTDNNPGNQTYYRIAQYDIDGKVQYTGVIRMSCATTDFFRVWPNPVTESVFVNITTARPAPVTIKIYDNKGALIKTQQSNLLSGNNQVSIAMKNLSAGIYQLIAEWGNGENRKTISLIKQ